MDNQRPRSSSIKTVARVEDKVLPILKLPDPCPIKINLTEDEVFLYIGQRDFQFNRSTGELTGSGTCLLQGGD